METSVAIIASARTTRKRCAALLADSQVWLVASVADPSDVPCSPDVTILFCTSSDADTLHAEISVACGGGRLVTVLPVLTRQNVRRAIRAGASAVVGLESIDEALLGAVHSVRAGQLSIPIDLANALEKPVLSSREKQILGMVVMGFTNGEVARRLFLAESTVKSHMSSIFGKLGVRSRKEAVARVLDPEEGLGLGILAISEEPGTTDALVAAPDATAA